MKIIRIIASIPELPPSAARHEPAADAELIRTDPPTVPIPFRSAPPRSSQPCGSGTRFPMRSVAVLAVISAACWAAAGWSERLRQQPPRERPPERLARESSAAGGQPGAITP